MTIPTLSLTWTINEVSMTFINTSPKLYDIGMLMAISWRILSFADKFIHKNAHFIDLRKASSASLAWSIPSAMASWSLLPSWLKSSLFSTHER